MELSWEYMTEESDSDDTVFSNINCHGYQKVNLRPGPYLNERLSIMFYLCITIEATKLKKKT